MRCPYDKASERVSGQEVIKALRKLGYYPARQRGSHVILIGPTGKMRTVPLHKSLKTGLLGAILREVGISVKVFIELLEDP